MPELPEVETIKRQLNRKIKGKRIKNVEVRLSSFVKLPLSKFKKIVGGSAIKNISRRAKLLIFDLDNEYLLAVHLKMTGQLVINGYSDKHTHLIYHFQDGSNLIHNDFRRFGFVKAVPKKQLLSFLSKNNFGPEPLAKEFTLSLFQERLAKRKRSKIKPLLMDQSFIAGIGNLYADEILFWAGVKPDKRAGELGLKSVERIYQGIKEILPVAIKEKGTSAENYVDAYGKKGNYLSLVNVYQREGQACVKCARAIKRIKLNNRSAYFCSKCQR